KTLAGVFVNDELAVGQRDGAEDAGVHIAHRLELVCRDGEAIDVRNAGVIGRRVDVLSVGREGAAFGDRLAEGERRYRLHLSVQQISDAVDVDARIAVDFADRRAEQSAIGRNVDVEQRHAVGKGDYLVERVMRRAHARQGVESIDV